jgi:hypothetical protein
VLCLVCCSCEQITKQLRNNGLRPVGTKYFIAQWSRYDGYCGAKRSGRYGGLSLLLCVIVSARTTSMEDR